ncbi:cutinase [Massarina eburnea CBS 473.64]|uniref:Cutinase n=1 Tax=Massarina eburnea CBS 473.64 TaxID=1395130 RepID=A0A6A6RZD9_9PLEO|nr:cutinase [Massarina eburnea CBS 473.64]
MEEFIRAIEDRATTTENGLSTDACKAVTIIYARGTNEAGNVGEVAGPPWFTVLRSSLTTAKVTVQGVDYSATIAGYLGGGDATGSAKMLSLINQAASKCPSTKIVLGGYSQGAQLVHNAAAKLTSAVTAQIAAVVVFGDPNNGKAVGSVSSSLVKSFCHTQDVVCSGSGGYTTHLTYNTDASAAGSFVVSTVGSV